MIVSRTRTSGPQPKGRRVRAPARLCFANRSPINRRLRRTGGSGPKPCPRSQYVDERHRPGKSVGHTDQGTAPVLRLSQSSHAGTPPKNSNAPSCEALQNVVPSSEPAWRNGARDHDSITANTHAPNRIRVAPHAQTTGSIGASLPASTAPRDTVIRSPRCCPAKVVVM